MHALPSCLKEKNANTLELCHRQQKSENSPHFMFHWNIKLMCVLCNIRGLMSEMLRGMYMGFPEAYVNISVNWFNFNIQRQIIYLYLFIEGL